ncbi:hypothetical protein T439DRAFT_372776 [Meredithblackwellia eburnea MCA 4105]
MKTPSDFPIDLLFSILEDCLPKPGFGNEGRARRQILASACLVNKTWCIVATPLLYEDVHLEGHKRHNRFCRSISKSGRGRHVQTLRLGRKGLLSERPYLGAIQMCLNVRNVFIHNCLVDLRHLSLLPKLQTLTLQSIKLCPSVYKLMATAHLPDYPSFTELPNLKRLCLFDLQLDEYETVLSLPRCFPALKELLLAGNPPTLILDFKTLPTIAHQLESVLISRPLFQKDEQATLLYPSFHNAKTLVLSDSAPLSSRCLWSLPRGIKTLSIPNKPWTREQAYIAFRRILLLDWTQLLTVDMTTESGLTEKDWVEFAQRCAKRGTPVHLKAKGEDSPPVAPFSGQATKIPVTLDEVEREHEHLTLLLANSFMQTLPSKALLVTPSSTLRALVSDL